MPDDWNTDRPGYNNPIKMGWGDSLLCKALNEQAEELRL